MIKLVLNKKEQIVIIKNLWKTNKMNKTVPSLKQFLLRQKVLSLYRRMLRSIRQIPDEHYRTEMLQWARSDFKNNAQHTDEITIKMLITQGERSLKELDNTINLAK